VPVVPPFGAHYPYHLPRCHGRTAHVLAAESGRHRDSGRSSLKSSGEVKLFIGICIAAILLVGVAVYPMLGRNNVSPIHTPGPIKSEYTRSDLVPAWSKIEGDPKASFTLVEFGDYQCPSCADGKKT